MFYINFRIPGAWSELVGCISFCILFKLHGHTSLCCVFEQDTYYPCLELVQPRKTRPDITEKLLTGT